MRGLRYDRILAGTAAALVLAAATGADAASTKSVPAHKPIKVSTPVLDPLPDPKPIQTAIPASSGTTTADITAEPAGSPVKAETAPVPSATPAAASESAAPDPFASLDPADRPIAEKIRDLLTAKIDKIFATKKEHAAVEAFYQNRNWASLWLDKGIESDRAKAAVARIRAADADGPRVQILAPDGLVLGLKLDGGEMFERLLEEKTIPLRPGDLYLFFTDGITEAMNAGDDCFGESRLGDLIQAHAHLPPDQLRERVLREIASFVGDAPQHDDMTMILLKIEDVGAAAVSRTIDADFAVAAGFVSAPGGARPAPARVG